MDADETSRRDVFLKKVVGAMELRRDGAGRAGETERVVEAEADGEESNSERWRVV